MTQTLRKTLTRHRSPLLRSVPPTVAAAILGNAFIGSDAMKWFHGLRSPATQLPMPGFLTVGGLYYLSIGTVLYRAAVLENNRSHRLGLVVLVGNELWNVALFGRRSTRGGFLAVLAFTLPVSLLQMSVKDDTASMLALAPYTAWVVGYDIPWTYLLWRLNP